MVPTAVSQNLSASHFPLRWLNLLLCRLLRTQSVFHRIKEMQTHFIIKRAADGKQIIITISKLKTTIPIYR